MRAHYRDDVLLGPAVSHEMRSVVEAPETTLEPTKRPQYVHRAANITPAPTSNERTNLSGRFDMHDCARAAQPRTV